MNTELEIKLLEINKQKIERKLLSLNAQLLYDGLLRNAIFHVVTVNDYEYVRVRSDGTQTTITYKEVKKDGLTSNEIEIETKSFDTSIELLTTIGLKKKRYDEKYRRRYKLNRVFFDFDTWPQIPTYLEIEAPTKYEIIEACQSVNLEFDNRFMGDTHDVFRYYGIDPDQIVDLSFNA